VSVDKIIRLGKRLDEVDAKPRPIKAVLASEDQKNKVLRQSKNLRNLQDGDWHKIFIYQDLMAKQREERKKAVQEMKDRQSKGETNLMVVNGRVVVRNAEHADTCRRNEMLHPTTTEIFVGSDFLCLYTNANGLVGKINKLRLITGQYHVIGVTETWANSNISDAELHIDGFTMFRKIEALKSNACLFSLRTPGGATLHSVTYSHTSISLTITT